MQLDQVINLGGRCQVAHQIRRRLGTERAHVFDWLITNADCMLELMISGPRTLTDPKRWRLSSSDREWFDHLHLIHTSGAISSHDIKRTDGFELGLPDMMGKYSYLCDRWEELMRSHDGHILFIRQQISEPQAGVTDGPVTPGMCHAMLARVAALRGPARDALLVIGDDDACGHVENDRLLYRASMKQSKDSDWQGDDKRWDDVFTDLQSHDVAQRSPRRLA